MNPNGTNYSWSNTAQWSQVPSAPVDQYSTTNQPTYSNQSNNGFAAYDQQPMSTSTEPRKDMIIRLYKSILGREADTAGLNYYLYNTHISELQIAKDMYESTEHNEILARSKDIREMIIKTEEATKRMNDMEYTLQSLQTLNDNYKNLIDQKTQIINELRSKLNLSGDSYPNEEDHNIHYSHPGSNNSHSVQQNQNNQYYDQNDQSAFILNDPFADDYEQRQGCLGWIKSWFRFN